MRHAWDWHMPWWKQARCWCAPFVDRPELADVGLSPLVFHRPMPGYVFHEHGEQGPLGFDCIITEDPVFENLDTIR